MTRSTRRITLLLITTVVVALAGVADACQIPVFRYALERWRADAFEAYVVHRGPLSDAHSAMVKKLEAATLNIDKPLNVRLNLVDRDDKDDKLARELIEVCGEPSGDLPQIWIDYPRFVDTDRMAYQGPMTEAVIDGLIDSPARREIVKRIISGESAVWVLVESGNKASRRVAGT